MMQYCSSNLKLYCAAMCSLQYIVFILRNNRTERLTYQLITICRLTSSRSQPWLRLLALLTSCA